MLATASDDKTAATWGAASGVRLLEIKIGRYGAVHWISDGAMLATVSFHKTTAIQVWDAVSGARLRELNGHYAPVRSASWSPDGAMLVTSASFDKTAAIWDAASGIELLALIGHNGAVHSASWSPDGAMLATASDDKTAAVWDAASGARLLQLKGHDNFVESASWSPDGTKLATTSFCSALRIWFVRV
jgi:WD40 repeat protein